MEYKTYRMYRQQGFAIANGGNCAEYLDSQFKATAITLKARNEKEAIKKGDKFWRQAEIGRGSFIMKEVSKEKNHE